MPDSDVFTEGLPQKKASEAEIGRALEILPEQIVYLLILPREYRELDCSVEH